MEKNQLKIAYLAPEIPALSATFVYNEILSLEKKGVLIVPISVHVPASPAVEETLHSLRARTIYLYRQSAWTFLKSNLKWLLKSPLRYLHTCRLTMSDAFKVGLAGHVGRGLFYRFFVASRVADILVGENCWHLHTHFAHIPTDIAMYASSLSGVPFSFTAHANDLFERGWLLKEKVTRAKVAMTISEYNRRFFTQQGADESKIKIVRCGVESDGDRTDKEKGRNASPTIGSLGRLVEKKGMDTLIFALADIHGAGVDFRLEIAGDGPQREALERLASEQGIGSKVVFRGPIPHDEVFAWLGSLDLFVLACRRDRQGDQDGIPVVLMEAMAAGIPVISTHISGIPELIEDGISGMLAEPNDPKGLSEKIKDVVTNPAMASSLAGAARRRIREEFDVDVNAERLRNLFREERHG
jgi:glycosyltransferase involved in cell wall biosynthesis